MLTLRQAACVVWGPLTCACVPQWLGEWGDRVREQLVRVGPIAMDVRSGMQVGGSTTARGFSRVTEVLLQERKQLGKIGKWSQV